MTSAEVTFRLKNEGAVQLANIEAIPFINHLLYHNEEIEVIVKKNKYVTTFKLIKP